MFSINNHPFAVEAFFESSIVLTYAIARNEVESMIPECLELDTLDAKWAFLAVAIVKTKQLRPKGFPEFTGNNFILIGCRLFVKYINNQGKRLRGLYILKSETDKVKMSVLGNIFTHYNYTTTDITFHKHADERTSVLSDKSDLQIVANTNHPADLPFNSPFNNWKEARRFAGPLPFTFSYNSKTKEVLIIEGVRQNWIPKPIEIISEHIGFIKQKKFNNVVLASAFMIENIPYYWKKGRTELWKGR